MSLLFIYMTTRLLLITAAAAAADAHYPITRLMISHCSDV